MRNEVMAFAQQMEKQLAANDDDKGEDSWRNDFDTAHFFKRLKEKRHELGTAVDKYERAQVRRVPRADMEKHRETILALAADMGNYAMFIADHTRALPEYDDGKDDPAFTDRDGDD